MKDTLKEWLEAVKQDGMELENVPDERKTPELCLVAVKQNGHALEFVPEKLMTPELCRTAVKNDADALGCVPEAMRTSELCDIALADSDFCEIGWIPASCLTEDRCIGFVQRYPSLLNEIPERFRTSDVCEEAVKRAPVALEAVPSPLLTLRFADKVFLYWSIAEKYRGNIKHSSDEFESACQKLFDVLPEDLRSQLAEKCRAETLRYRLPRDGELCICSFVPRVARNEAFNIAVMSKKGEQITALDKDELTEAVCEAALSSCPLALKHIPAKMKTPDMCRNAVMRDSLALQGVPAKMKTPELCKAAVDRNGLALKFVPDKLKTLELCRLAAQRAEEGVFKYIPEDLLPASHDAAWNMSEEDFLKAAEMNGLALQWIPEKFRTKAVCEVAVGQNGTALAWVPKKLKTPELCLAAVESNGMALEYVPEDMLTEALCKVAVRQNSLAIRWMPQEYMTEEFCMEAVLNAVFYMDVLQSVPDKYRKAVNERRMQAEAGKA